jgi:hypothetical protein
MQVTLSTEQAEELQALVAETVRDMSHEIAATDNAEFRAGLIARRRTLEAVARSLEMTTEGDQAAGHLTPRVWTVEVAFTEDDDRTRADVMMRAAEREWHGWGRARRNPVDPDVPAIGEELAAARALADLSHQLVEAAARGVEAFEGRPVHLHT